MLTYIALVLHNTKHFSFLAGHAIFILLSYAKTVNTFKNRLDRFWSNQDMQGGPKKLTVFGSDNFAMVNWRKACDM